MTPEEQKQKNESWEKVKTLGGILMVLGILWWAVKSMLGLWKHDRQAFWFIVLGGIALYLFFTFLDWVGITHVWSH